jgi:hypothetical protein
MEQKWLTKKIEYEGFPLYLRKPDYQDIFVYQDNFPNVFHVTQNLKDVKSNGLPESDYNESLSEFDGQMCKLFDKRDEGIIFLVETFAGKRHYYYFISVSADYEKRIEKIKRENPDVDIETDSYADKDWGFLKDYPTKLY